MDAVKLSPEDFFSALETAESWDLERETLTGDFILVTMDEHGVNSFRSPNLRTMSLSEFNGFVSRIRDLIKTPSIARKMMVLRAKGEPNMGNLVVHAKRELQLLGEEEETIAGYIRVVRAFASMGHSGGSAAVAVPVIIKLLQFKNLTPLTNDPDEWIHHPAEGLGGGQDLWQNVRCGAAMSRDGGKTYYFVDQKPRRFGRRKIYKSAKRETDSS